MGKHLVLVGGGHAHMMALTQLSAFIEKGHRVTVIGPSPYHYYSGMGPGMLGGYYTPDEIRFATRHVVQKQGGTFVLGKAKQVDPKAKIIHLESGDTIPYDVVSFNAGSYVPGTMVNGIKKDIFSVKPIERLLDARAAIVDRLEQQPIAVGIVGGGPSAAEIAGNIWRLARHMDSQRLKITIFAGKNFMMRFPPGVRKRIAGSLEKRGITIHERGYVSEVGTGRVTLASGKTHAVDFIFLALGVRPSALFKASGLPTGPDGGLRVNAYLQSIEHPEIFGGGDCIYFADRPLDKVGVYAVRENPVLMHNLAASLNGAALEPFDPGGDYLLVFNMGDGTGVLRKGPLLFGGRLAFRVKDEIDRKFMRKFQAFESIQ